MSKLTFSLQLLNILNIDRHTDCVDNAGDHSSPRIDKQIWPLLYFYFVLIRIICEYDLFKFDTESYNMRMYRYIFTTEHNLQNMVEFILLFQVLE